MQPPPPNETPFAFLKDTIDLLVVDDEPELLRPFIDQLAEIPLLNVTVVFSAQEAENVLREQHIHMCLLDLGICDVNNDELHLVKTFAAKTCFLMITGSGGTERAVQAIGAGALYCIDKPLVFTNVAPMIAAYIQHEIHYPRPRGNASDRFMESVRILNSKQPESVD